MTTQYFVIYLIFVH